MYIAKQSLENGYNEYISLNSPAGRLSMMDVGVVILEQGERYTFGGDAEKECGIVLVEGAVTFCWDGETETANRPNCFDYKGWCLHLPKGKCCTVTAAARSELYVQSALNEREFPAKMYRPDDVIVQRLGADGEVAGKMRRNVCTYFEYANAPYSNMVLGEVINIPGLWSSYPPHYHPQPEVYYYRFDKPQGFGACFIGEEAFKIADGSFCAVPGGLDHPQVTAPGYPMYYVWMIRHFPGDPWKDRNFNPAHQWLLQHP